MKNKYTYLLVIFLVLSSTNGIAQNRRTFRLSSPTEANFY